MGDNTICVVYRACTDQRFCLCQEQGTHWAVALSIQSQSVHQPKALSVLVEECALSVLKQGTHQARILSWHAQGCGSVLGSGMEHGVEYL